MNKYGKHEIQVGIAVLIAAVALVWGVLWLQQVKVAGSVFHFSADFPTVGGLKEHDRVQVRGIKAGAVERLEVRGNKVRVHFYVDRSFPLTNQARVRLMSQGIVGDRLVEIDPGTGNRVPEGYVFQGEVQQDMMEMAANGAEILEDAKALTRDLRALIHDLRAGDRLTGTMDDTRSALQSLTATSRDLRPELLGLVRDLRRTNTRLRAALVGPDSLLPRTLADADRALARADSLAAVLVDATTSLAALADDLRAGKGTAGRILTDDSLYALAESTLTAARDLIADIKARPKRYFKMSVF